MRERASHFCAASRVRFDVQRRPDDACTVLHDSQADSLACLLRVVDSHAVVGDLQDQRAVVHLHERKANLRTPTMLQRIGKCPLGDAIHMDRAEAVDLIDRPIAMEVAGDVVQITHGNHQPLQNRPQSLRIDVGRYQPGGQLPDMFERSPKSVRKTPGIIVKLLPCDRAQLGGRGLSREDFDQTFGDQPQSGEFLANAVVQILADPTLFLGVETSNTCFSNSLRSEISRISAVKRRRWSISLRASSTGKVVPSLRRPTASSPLPMTRDTPVRKYRAM